MKLGSFERATAIKTEIDKLTSLSKVLCQASQGDYSVGAVRKDCYGHWEIMSEALLSQQMLAAFNNIIGVQVSNLKNEFESL